MGSEQYTLGLIWMGFIGIYLVLIAVIIWSMVWKALALWRAARLGSKGWFVALFLINTMGILEIIYLYVITKDASKSHAIPPSSNTDTANPK